MLRTATGMKTNSVDISSCPHLKDEETEHQGDTKKVTQLTKAELHHERRLRLKASALSNLWSDVYGALMMCPHVRRQQRTRLTEFRLLVMEKFPMGETLSM